MTPLIRRYITALFVLNMWGRVRMPPAAAPPAR
jgi:hypothetical protein